MIKNNYKYRIQNTKTKYREQKYSATRSIHSHNNNVKGNVFTNKKKYGRKLE